MPAGPPSSLRRPSFNGALAAGGRGLCVLNTVVSLLGACLAAFAASSAFKGRLDMVHIQNATLAGGAHALVRPLPCAAA